MKYAKPSQDASEDFVAIRDQIEAAGFQLLSGAWAVGVLSVDVDQSLPFELQHALGLTAEQEG